MRVNGDWKYHHVTAFDCVGCGSGKMVFSAACKQNLGTILTRGRSWRSSHQLSGAVRLRRHDSSTYRAFENVFVVDCCMTVTLVYTPLSPPRLGACFPALEMSSQWLESTLTHLSCSSDTQRSQSASIAAQLFPTDRTLSSTL